VVDVTVMVGVVCCEQAMHNVSNACHRSADEMLQCLELAIEQRKIVFRQAGYDRLSLHSTTLIASVFTYCLPPK